MRYGVNTLWRWQGVPDYCPSMRARSLSEKRKSDTWLPWFIFPSSQRKTLLFGDLVTAVYDTYGTAEAGEVLRRAVNTHVVGFLGSRRYLIH